MDELIKKANKVFKEHFPNTTWFERALFFSWSCAIKDCTFCYMSTQEKKNQRDDDKAIRSRESLYAETILCKMLGWKIGFFTGGINAYKHEDLLEIIKVIKEITKEKVWISLGAIPESYLKKYEPYIEGVVGSIETVNKSLHKKVCPSKPIEPYVRMFKHANNLGIKTAMTIILGLGETKEDFEALEEFIRENKIVKIHIYALNPIKGTVFEKTPTPTNEYHAWYVAKTRIAFPNIDMQIGIWTDKIDRVSLLLRAGTNSISKFPITRQFGKEKAKMIEEQAKLGGREFLGTLTKLPNVNWDAEVEKLSLSSDVKEKVKVKLQQYLKRMAKN